MDNNWNPTDIDELAKFFSEETKGRGLSINKIEFDIDDIYKKPYIPSDKLKSIKNADVLLVPFEGYKDTNEPLFPEDTDRFYQYLKKSGQKAELCISDNHFETLGLHSDLIEIATIVTNEFVVPVLLGLISSYLYDAVKSLFKKKNEVDSRIKLIVKKEKKNETVEVTFEGTVEEFGESIEKIKEEVLDD